MAEDALPRSNIIAASMAEGLRNRAWRCLRSSRHLHTTQKLDLLHRFLHAFARLSDLESQLVVRYEILCLRESCDSEMKVDVKEWISFAEDCLSAGFPGNASKAFEKAISQMQGCQAANLEPESEFGSCSSKHVQLKAMAESINDQLSKGSCNGDAWDSVQGKSTTVSKFVEGLKRKERAKLQMLHARNI